MDAREYQDYVRRITDADSVADVHRVVTEAQLDHPADPDVEALDATGLTIAAGILADYPQRRMLRGSGQRAAAA